MPGQCENNRYEDDEKRPIVENRKKEPDGCEIDASIKRLLVERIIIVDVTAYIRRDGFENIYVKEFNEKFFLVEYY